MKKRILSIMLFWAVMLCIITGGLHFLQKQSHSQDKKAEQILAVNEIVIMKKCDEVSNLTNDFWKFFERVGI